MGTKKKISVVGVPMDLGQIRRGVDMGPSAMRYAGLLEDLKGQGFEVIDYGDLTIHRSTNGTNQEQKIRNLQEVISVSEELCIKLDETITKGGFPLVLGGDHSISIGSIAGIAKHYQNLGVIWYDAHADLNTVETSPSGNIHGMPLAINLGFGHPLLTKIGDYSPKVTPENIVIIGARSIDEGERTFIQEKGIKVFTMHEIDRRGMTTVMEEAIRYLEDRTDGVHLSFDLDSIDPIYAPGVGTPVRGGVTYRESHLAMELLAEADIITSAEFVEVNPILDDKNTTADIAIELVASLLGKQLL
ncbi:arginase [Alkalihalobacillus sp. MEB130]|uniref:arginase n=1 Tax=Alkalihalobacillus sp. MEB130 TaxID=2976704 RepID=UPI0028DFDEE5|nr:arginase [Alkalihalobacillus sp. MEB130]MDT8862340.1 arginase [Alkalihalobacillus sp. MEB130]